MIKENSVEQRESFFQIKYNPRQKHIKLIYRFHANVECRLRLLGWSYRKIIGLTLHSIRQTREKWHSLV